MCLYLLWLIFFEKKFILDFLIHFCLLEIWSNSSYKCIQFIARGPSRTLLIFIHWEKWSERLLVYVHCLRDLKAWTSWRVKAVKEFRKNDTFECVFWPNTYMYLIQFRNQLLYFFYFWYNPMNTRVRTTNKICETYTF